jgi:Tn3 transposase DDE domain
LLKVEQLHALAWEVFYGWRGRINAREPWEQMNTVLLNLILACLVYWQAPEIFWFLSQCDRVANGIDFNTFFPKSPRLRAIPPISLTMVLLLKHGPMMVNGTNGPVRVSTR